jgi:hypothetical protein
MKALLKVMFVCGVLSLANSTATAQTNPPASSTYGRSFGLLRVSSIADAPFSAVVEITHLQTLADGTHISTRAKLLSYRDSSGRVVYQDFTVTAADKEAPESPTEIQIWDPVAELGYTISPDRKTARRHKLPAFPPAVGDLSRNVAPAELAVAPHAPDSGIKFVTEDLGSQHMQGVLVTGSRNTQTIPVGVRGNDRELKSTGETWFAPDLGFELLSKLSGPRSGDTEIRVTSLDQSEPDPTLFQVPAGYTIIDQ